MDKKRDEKGRFKPGWKGGPGRGKRNDDVLLDDPEKIRLEAIKILYGALKSDDEKTQLRAAQLLATLFNKDQKSGSRVISETLVEMLSGGRNDFEDTGGDVIDGKNFY
jgi:hypothetical protein